MKLLVALLMTICAGSVLAQPASDVLKNDSQSLRERFVLLKSRSQNYQQYKVINESVLDGWWKIVTDSIQAKQQLVHQTKAEVLRLQSELNQSKETLKQKEASMSEVEYASTHINVLGINFDKSVFTVFVGVIVLMLGVAIAFLVYSLRMARQNMKTKSDLAESITNEYEDYKRKAMEKQTKLSRELQNERNKLMELGAR